MIRTPLLLAAVVSSVLACAPAYGQNIPDHSIYPDPVAGYGETTAPPHNTTVTILLNQITRLLVDQRFDLEVEVRDPMAGGRLQLSVNGADVTRRLASYNTELDCDGTKAIVYYSTTFFSFPKAGEVKIEATFGGATDSRVVTVIPFDPASNDGDSDDLGPRPRSAILFIGDAMGTAYRDAGRIVGRSMNNGMYQGFFKELQEMDRMPVTGMVMTYGVDRVVPDSANTAAAWSTGNKTFNAALGVFPDGDDCMWQASGPNASNLQYVLDNPRVETLWEYLKRKYDYATGIVTTADVTDATPAGEGSHTGSRYTRFEIARQFLENPFLGGRPGFDVIMGGGTEQFQPFIRTDGRNLIQEFQNQGYRYVTTKSQLSGITGTRVLGLFKTFPGNTTNANGVQAKTDSNMSVAYDKLQLIRPGSEVPGELAPDTDQPFLEDMTSKAISVLSRGGRPFILMVEGAQIDKQSHPNNASGTIWDVIELDKAVGYARKWATQNGRTLVVVTADHDQTMSILGVNQIPQADYVDNTTSMTLTYTSPGSGTQTATIFKDSPANVRSSYPYSASGGDPNTSGKSGPPTFDYQDPNNGVGFPNYVEFNGTGYPDNVTHSPGEGDIRLSVGYRSGNHAGSSVPVTAEGPGAFLFIGYMDQTDVMFKIATALAGDTAAGDSFVKNVLNNPKYPQTPGK
jgi:alkaline phosphatase